MQSSQEIVTSAVAKCRSVFLAVGIVSFFINVLMLTGPIFMLQIYDRVLASRSISTLVALAGIAIGLYVFFGLLEGLRSRILARVSARFDGDLSGATFASSAALPLVAGRKADGVEPVRDLETVRQFLSGPGPSAFFDMPWLPAYLAVVFIFHPVLGFIAAGGALLICVLIGLNELLVRKPLAEASQQSARRNALVQDTRRNAEAATAMGMVSGLQARWLKDSEIFLKLQSKATDRAATFASLIKTLRFMLQSAILGVGAYLAISEQITPGVMIAASIITARAVAPIELAVSQWRAFVLARQSFRRLKDILRAGFTAVPDAELPLPSHSLQVEEAFVAAPGCPEPIVQKISFDLKAGEALGIIGPSGSGKSSLGRALVGVWPTSRGGVRLDGADLAQWERDRLGQAIGYLPQDVQLFAGTVAENIARFRPNWRSEDVIAAAKLANAHDLIARLPNGYDTEVGEGGAVLSGGQRQRIALARALFGDPFLVVLDEPNSNLDGEGEAALTEALVRTKARGRVFIVIAHRPSAITAVDKLLVLKGGRMNAYGPKDEVLTGGAVRGARDGGGLKVVHDG